MLETYVKNLRKEKDILLMTHIVLGYPTFEDSLRIIDAMVEGGVDLMELQIPFSEPIADGPVILRANQLSLRGGATVQKCLFYARKTAELFGIPFLFMTYYNILFKFGVPGFAEEMAGCRMAGAIVPDLPPEEADEYLQAMTRFGLAPIFLFSPTTPDERMKLIGSFAKGFVYCVARKGVTGMSTDFSDHLESYLARCRCATHLPLALGFGVKEKKDIDFLRGKADIAVIGSHTIRLVEEQGIGAVKAFINQLTAK